MCPPVDKLCNDNSKHGLKDPSSGSAFRFCHLWAGINAHTDLSAISSYQLMITALSVGVAICNQVNIKREQFTPLVSRTDVKRSTITDTWCLKTLELDTVPVSLSALKLDLKFYSRDLERVWSALPWHTRSLFKQLALYKNMVLLKIPKQSAVQRFNSISSVYVGLLFPPL